LNLTKEIQEAVCKAETKKGNHVAENFSYFYIGELDVISVTPKGFVSEFEVKISRADFKADAKKQKWYYFNNGLFKYVPNYFTYVCPMGMIQEHEIKPYMGLIWYDEDILTIIKKPKRIHSEKRDYIKLITKMLTVNNWKAYFGAQKLTILNREIKARNTPQAESEWLTIASNLHKNTNPKHIEE